MPNLPHFTRILSIGCFLLVVSRVSAQNNSGYTFKIDLTTIQNDEFNVELKVSGITADTILYNIPETVPGTYSDDNYGDFIDHFKAMDAEGRRLPVKHISNNVWEISGARHLRRLTYLVNDTYDDQLRAKKVFEPTGTNIQKDSNYIINTYALMGYFTGMEELPYDVHIRHPKKMYGSTAMTAASSKPDEDEYRQRSYRELADNPIMYCVPDTSTIKVNNADVLISVYSPNHIISARYLAEHLDTLLQAQGKYLGGHLPVSKYAFIIYFSDKPSLSGAMGALEHSYSSLYYMMESNPEAIQQQFKDFAAHEFFHILTPLTLHSEEIQYFDFAHPRMSEHLWLYEGSTEYHAHLVQVRYGLIPLDHFLQEISNKLTNSQRRFNDSLPMTFVSKHVLEPMYAQQYGNVYEKGALISLCLDIMLRNLSHGKYSVIQLVQDLSIKYGKSKPFKDQDLFDDIGRLTYPSIEAFLIEHVSKNVPIPYDSIFNLVGLSRTEQEPDKVLNLGGVRSKAANGKIYISDTSSLNTFGRKLGYKIGDTIVSINSTSINANNFFSFLAAWRASVKEGDSLSIIISRGPTGENQLVTIRTVMESVQTVKYNSLHLNPGADQHQLQLRNWWLYGYQSKSASVSP